MIIFKTAEMVNQLIDLQARYGDKVDVDFFLCRCRKEGNEKLASSSCRRFTGMT